MNDRFKFRFYAVNYKTYVDATIDSFIGSDMIPIWKNGNFLTIEKTTDVIPEQCTGLKDKNGKLIYEGDWLKTKDDCYCYVVWYDGFWWVKSLPSEAMDLEHSEFYKECEVVGNIHNNPNFMEENND